MNNDTYQHAKREAGQLSDKFMAEVIRLVLDKNTNDVSLGLIFGVALENIADNYLRGDRSTKQYKQVKKI